MARYIAHVPDPDQLQELAAERDDVLKVLPRVHMLVLDCGQATADELADDPRVEFVEADAQGEPASSPQTIVNEWQLDRIDQRELPLDDEYHWTRDGTGVHVYIVDSGIRDTHEAFAGRIGAGFTAVGGTAYTDNEGHGTAVAGLAVGATTGAARGATIHSVRVWDTGGINTADFVDGIEWILNNHDFEKPGVVNVSLTFSPLATIDDAVEDLLEAGLQVCCAAGNNDDLASTLSPARVAEVITVSSTEDDDAFRDGHNFGPAVDLLAPGRDTWTTQNSGDTAYGTFGGTSAASALSCGVVALILEQAPNISVRNLKDSLLRGATEGEITGLPSETPNLLLYSLSEPFLGASQPQIKIGTFEKRSGTGLQTVTWSTDDYWPEDEYPEAIIFFGIGVNADPINDEQAFTPLRWGLGFATPNGSASHGVSKLNTSGLNNVKRRASVAAFQTLQPGGSSNRNIAAFDTELVNGFRLNWTVNDHDFDHLIGFIAIGGGGIQAKAVVWGFPGSTGLFPVDGIGFEPDIVFHSFSRFDLSLGSAPQDGPGSVNLGAMLANGDQWVMSTQLPPTTSPATVRSTNDDICIAYATTSLNAQPINRAAFESMDEDGFTLDVLGATTDGYGLSLAIKGGEWNVGMFEQADSMGAQQISLPNMHPLGLLFCTAMLTDTQVNDGSKATAFLSIGAGNENLDRAISNASANGSNFDRQLQNNTAIIVNTETDFDPIAAQASVTSLEDEQATITWDSADNTSAMIGYVAFGEALSGAPPVPQNVQAVAQDHQSILVTWDPVEP